MDKGVKKGVFKQNKAARLKSRITKRLAVQA
jgi:ribosomal protein S20